VKFGLLVVSVLVAVASAGADEWGSWDDLPDNLLTTTSDPNQAIDRLYDQLQSRSSDDLSGRAEDLENWLLTLNLDFQDNSELSDLLDRLQGESDEDIADEIEDWLKDQLDDANDALEDDLKELEKHQDELDDEREDELDDLEDELDEIDEIDEPDEPEVEGP